MVEGAQHAGRIPTWRNLKAILGCRVRFFTVIQKDGLEQPSREIRSFIDESIENGHRADDAAASTRFRRLQAKKTHYIRRIAVVVDVGGRLVEANGLFLRGLAEVAHMTKQIALRILPARSAEMQPETPEE